VLWKPTAKSRQTSHHPQLSLTAVNRTGTSLVIYFPADTIRSRHLLSLLLTCASRPRVRQTDAHALQQPAPLLVRQIRSCCCCFDFCHPQAAQAHRGGGQGDQAEWLTTLARQRAPVPRDLLGSAAGQSGLRRVVCRGSPRVGFAFSIKLEPLPCFLSFKLSPPRPPLPAAPAFTIQVPPSNRNLKGTGKTDA
jgi:hypothetical protein